MRGSILCSDVLVLRPKKAKSGTVAQKDLGGERGCRDETEHCSDTLCQDDKGQFVTTQGSCVCSDGHPATANNCAGVS
jgi:hypothetical protein